jgi:outer membrane protein assembly factor BamB
MNKAIITGLVSLSLLQAQAKDWPQWGGGQRRNMYSEEKGLPDRFEPGKLKKGTEEVDLSTTKNVKWVAKLGSQSYGNATVSNGRVFVGTNNDAPRSNRDEGDRSIMMVFSEKDGSFLWQLVVPKLASGKVNDWENLGLLSSPTVEGDYVYLVTSRCEVICLDVNGLSNGNQGMQDEGKYIAGPGKPPVQINDKDADIIWVYDMINDLGVFPHNASNCSVLVVGDIVYACTSNGQDWSHSNIPSPLSPSFIALNKKTGELLGEDDAGIGPKIFHGQWSSPSLGVVNGKPQVYFGGGDGVLYAFDPQPSKGKVDGEDVNLLKRVWWFDANPPEYKTNKTGKAIRYPSAEGPSEINATPVFWKNRVYVPIGQDPEHGEGVGNLVCVDATGTGDVTKTKKIWNFQKINRSISTVSITPEGLLFVGDFSGFVYCLNADTGEHYWTHDMKAHMWGSTMVADGKVYVGDEDGDLVVLEANKTKKIISETNLGAPVYSTPVIANGVLYIASNTHLYALYDEARAKAVSDQPQKIELKK